MRILVQPPLSLHCKLCDGELRFNRIESDDPVLDTEVEIFVCVKCGRAHLRRIIHDRYTAHTTMSIPRRNVDQPDGAGSKRYA